MWLLFGVQELRRERRNFAIIPSALDDTISLIGRCEKKLAQQAYMQHRCIFTLLYIVVALFVIILSEKVPRKSQAANYKPTSLSRREMADFESTNDDGEVSLLQKVTDRYVGETCKIDAAMKNLISYLSAQQISASDTDGSLLGAGAGVAR